MNQNVIALPPLPPHDRAPRSLVAACCIAEWPRGTFLENLVVAADGTIFCSVHPTGELFRVGLNGGTPELVGSIGGPAAGLLLGEGGRIFVMSGYPGQAPAAVWTLTLQGEPALWATVESASFLNGATLFDENTLLVVDSLDGSIFQVGMKTTSVSLWFKDDRLKQRQDTPLFPGANGIKRRGGGVIVSNTDRGQVFNIEVTAEGRAGGMSLIADRLLIDDFALGPDRAVYGCAHAYNELVRLDSDGSRLVLAGPEQGIVNPTAAAFGRNASDSRALYVTTTGGVAAPLPGGLEPARLVRLDLSGFV